MMLPRWHIFWGAIFTLLIFLIAPETPFLYLSLIFLASFLIDFDHYLNAVIKTGKWGLFSSFEYHKIALKIQKREKERGIRIKGDFHLFHTIEFHILVALLGLIWEGFFYIVIGMFFHSILDVIYIIKYGYGYRREFFFINWALKKSK